MHFHISTFALHLSLSFSYWKVQRDSWVFMWRGSMGLLNCNLVYVTSRCWFNKEKKRCFWLFLIGGALWFCGSIFSCVQFGLQVKLHAQKIWGVEVNWYQNSPNTKIPYRQKLLWLENFEMFAIFSHFLENKNYSFLENFQNKNSGSLHAFYYFEKRVFFLKLNLRSTSG